MAAQVTDWLQSELGVSLQKPGSKDGEETTVEEAFSTGYKFAATLCSLGIIDNDEFSEFEDKRSSAARMRNFKRLKGILHEELGISLSEQQSIDIMTEQRGAALRLLLQVRLAAQQQLEEKKEMYQSGSKKAAKTTKRAFEMTAKDQTMNILFPKTMSSETMERLSKPSRAQAEFDRHTILNKATSGQLLSEKDVMERAMLNDKTLNQTLLELKLLPFENQHRRLASAAGEKATRDAEKASGSVMEARSRDIQTQETRKRWLESFEQAHYDAWKESLQKINNREREMVDLELRIAQSKIQASEMRKLQDKEKIEEQLGEFNETLRRLGLTSTSTEDAASSDADLQIHKQHSSQAGKQSLVGSRNAAEVGTLKNKSQFHSTAKDAAFSGFKSDNLYSTMATPMGNDLLVHLFSQKYGSKASMSEEREEAEMERRQETPFEFYDRLHAHVKDNLNVSETKQLEDNLREKIRYRFRAKSERETRRRLNAARQEAENRHSETQRQHENMCNVYWEQSSSKRPLAIKQYYDKVYRARHEKTGEKIRAESEQAISLRFQRNLSAEAERLEKAGDDRPEKIKALSDRNKMKRAEKSTRHYDMCKEIVHDVMGCVDMAIDDTSLMSDSGGYRILRKRFSTGQRSIQGQGETSQVPPEQVELFLRACRHLCFGEILLSPEIGALLRSCIGCTTNASDLLNRGSLLSCAPLDYDSQLPGRFDEFRKLYCCKGILSFQMQRRIVETLASDVIPPLQLSGCQLTLLSAFQPKKEDPLRFEALALPCPRISFGKGVFCPALIGRNDAVRECYAFTLAARYGVGLVNKKTIVCISLLSLSIAAYIDELVAKGDAIETEFSELLFPSLAAELKRLVTCFGLGKREAATVLEVVLRYCKADLELLSSYAACIIKLKEWEDHPSKETATALKATVNEAKERLLANSDFDCLIACGVVFKALSGDRPWVGRGVGDKSCFHRFDDGNVVSLGEAETAASTFLGRRKSQRINLCTYAASSASRRCEMEWPTDWNKPSSGSAKEKGKKQAGKDASSKKKQDSTRKEKETPSGSARESTCGSSVSLFGGLVADSSVLSKKRIFVREPSSHETGEPESQRTENFKSCTVESSPSIESLLHRCPFFHGALGTTAKALGRKNELGPSMTGWTNSTLDAIFGHTCELGDQCCRLNEGMVLSGLPFNVAEAIVLETSLLGSGSSVGSGTRLKRRSVPLSADLTRLCEECVKKCTTDAEEDTTSARSSNTRQATEEPPALSVKTVSLQKDTILCSLQAPYARAGFALCGYQRCDSLENELFEETSEEDERSQKNASRFRLSSSQETLGCLMQWEEQRGKGDDAAGLGYQLPKGQQSSDDTCLHDNLGEVMKNLGLESLAEVDDANNGVIAGAVVHALCGFLGMDVEEDGSLLCSTLIATDFVDQLDVVPSKHLKWEETHLHTPLSTLELALRVALGTGRDGSGDVTFRGVEQLDSTASSIASMYTGSLQIEPGDGEETRRTLSCVIEVPTYREELELQPADSSDKLSARDNVMLWDYLAFTLGAIPLKKDEGNLESSRIISSTLPLVALSNHAESSKSVFLVGDLTNDDPSSIQLVPPVSVTRVEGEEAGSARKPSKKKDNKGPSSAVPEVWALSEITPSSWDPDQRPESIVGFYGGKIPWIRLPEEIYTNKEAFGVTSLCSEITGAEDHSSAPTKFLHDLSMRENASDICNLGCALTNAVFPSKFEATQLSKTLFCLSSSLESSAFYYMENALFSFLEFLRSTHVEMRLLLEKIDAKAFPESSEDPFTTTNNVKERIYSARRNTEGPQASIAMKHSKPKAKSESAQQSYSKGIQELQALIGDVSRLLLGQLPSRQRQRLHRKGLCIEFQQDMLSPAESNEVFATFRRKLVSCEELLWNEAGTRRDFCRKFASMYERNITVDYFLNSHADLLIVAMMVDTAHSLADCLCMQGFNDILSHLGSAEVDIRRVDDLVDGTTSAYPLSPRSVDIENFIRTLETAVGEEVSCDHDDSQRLENVPLTGIETELHQTDGGTHLLGFYHRIYKSLQPLFDNGAHYQRVVRNALSRLARILQVYVDFANSIASYQKRNAGYFENWICSKLQRDDKIIRETMGSIKQAVDTAEDIFNAYNSDKGVSGEYISDEEVTNSVNSMNEDRFLRSDGLESPVKLLEFERQNALPYNTSVYNFPSATIHDIIDRLQRLFQGMRKGLTSLQDGYMGLDSNKQCVGLHESHDYLVELLKECASSIELQRQQARGSDDASFQTTSISGSANIAGMSVVPYGTIRPQARKKTVSSDQTDVANRRRQLIKQAAKGEYVPEEILFELMSRLSTGTSKITKTEAASAKSTPMLSSFRWDPGEEHYYLPANTVAKIVDELHDPSWYHSAAREMFSLMDVEHALEEHCKHNIISVDNARAIRLTGITSSEFEGSLWIHPMEACQCLEAAMDDNDNSRLNKVYAHIRRLMWHAFKSISAAVGDKYTCSGGGNGTKHLLSAFLEDGQGGAAKTIHDIIDFSVSRSCPNRRVPLRIFVANKKTGDSLCSSFPLAVIRGVLMRCVQIFGVALTGFSMKHPPFPEQLLLSQRAQMLCNVALAKREPPLESSRTLSTDAPETVHRLLPQWQYLSAANWFEVSQQDTRQSLELYEREIKILQDGTLSKARRAQAARNLCTHGLVHVVLNSQERTTERVINTAEEGDNILKDGLLSAARCTEGERINSGKNLTISVGSNVRDDGESTLLGSSEKLRESLKKLYSLDCPACALHIEGGKEASRAWAWLSASVRRSYLAAQRKVKRSSKAGIQHNAAWPEEISSVDIGAMFSDLTILTYKSDEDSAAWTEQEFLSTVSQNITQDAAVFERALLSLSTQSGVNDVTDHLIFPDECVYQDMGDVGSLWSFLRHARERRISVPH
eukprot:gb/GECG01009528.1/.p1 GENE.gb/GECG01009528.1/~~gb/GECG01009528.1/.p1  ORF type:complete len:2898 (+),score=387.39 gb/GECG01009528.1/:1-8694(+)